MERNLGMSATIICAGRSSQTSAEAPVRPGVPTVDGDIARRSHKGAWLPGRVPGSCTVRSRRIMIAGAGIMLPKPGTIDDGNVAEATGVVTTDKPAFRIPTAHPVSTHPSNGLPLSC
jgi:hypothetical protein